MASDSDEFGAFLVGFIVGGVAGAVVSLLFAPQSGEETRALIREKSIELRDYASQSAEEALANAEAAAAEARTRAEELTKVARRARKKLQKKLAVEPMNLARKSARAAKARSNLFADHLAKNQAAKHRANLKLGFSSTRV